MRDLVNDARLVAMVAALPGYRVSGDTMWSWIVEKQKQLILEHWAAGTFEEDMFATTFGTGGGTNDPARDRAFIADFLDAYAKHRGISRTELFDLLCPVPDVGMGRRFAVEHNGNMVCERHAWAYHYAERVSRLCCLCDVPIICEIGGGIGYTPYYARQFGIGTWVSIDLLPSLIHQYVLLSQYMPVTFNEPMVSGAVNLYDAFSDYRSHLSAPLPVWMNTDSFCEMDRAVARAYIDLATMVGCRMFYSMNRTYAGISAWHMFSDAGWACISVQPFPRTDYDYMEHVFRRDEP
jgi:hypothetical protein